MAVSTRCTLWHLVVIWTLAWMAKGWIPKCVSPTSFNAGICAELGGAVLSFPSPSWLSDNLSPSQLRRRSCSKGQACWDLDVASSPQFIASALGKISTTFSIQEVSIYFSGFGFGMFLVGITREIQARKGQGHQQSLQDARAM